MRITEVRVFERVLVKARSYNMSTSAVADPVTTAVEVVTDAGYSGWGEACPAGPLYAPVHVGGIQAALGLLGPAVLGLDPTQFGLLQVAMNQAVNGANEAKAAIDIACWDLAGKASGKRVCELLGGPRMDPVSTYHVISIGTADESAAHASKLQDDGLLKLQLKAGGRHIDEDIESIRAVSRVVRPGVDLFVDVNRGWTTTEAIQVSEACADLRLSFEQPCNTFEECARAKPHLRHPLLLDESATDLATIARAIVEGVADGFGIKLTRIGGLTGMQAVRDLCAATRTPMSCDDSWGGDIIAAACVHLGSTLDPQISRGVWIADPYLGEHYDEVNGPRIVGGRIALPSGPGLGLEIPDGLFGAPVSVHC
ncbi:MAG: mandelate racemase/muconate lactonizing enzyme family protein [Acidimicrobiales bacterium]